MSAILDKEFINRISYSLEGFKWLRDSLAVCRCPICGDSKKSKHKKRFYFYRNVSNESLNDYYSVKCHNCPYHNTFYRFLEEQDINLFSEYKMEKFKESGNRYSRLDKLFTPKPEKYESNFDKEKIKELNQNKKRTILDGCVPLNRLAPENDCILYVKGRNFPLSAYNVLWYTDNFKKVAQSFCEESENDLEHLPTTEPRLIIPFFDLNFNLTCIQGRSLNKNSNMRYITIKKNETSSKLFGRERIDWNKQIYTLEGPLDSLFLDNCVATADANLMSCGIENSILIPDKQPRNIQLCASIEKFINNNYQVCLLPESLNGKDINEFIQNGLTKEELMKIIQENTFQGLRAKMHFSKWKKC